LRFESRRYGGRVLQEPGVKGPYARGKILVWNLEEGGVVNVEVKLDMAAP